MPLNLHEKYHVARRRRARTLARPLHVRASRSFAWRALRLSLACAIIGLAMVASCGRRPAPPRESGAPVETLQHPSARFPITDPLLGAAAPRLAPWVRMWRQAMPRFELDSLHRAGVFPTLAAGNVQPWEGAYRRSVEASAVFAILSEPDPTGRRRLVFDAYQVVESRGDRVEIGGEPDSAPLLIDLGRGLMNAFATCGTSCGYHWGAWLDSSRFILAGWMQDGPDATARAFVSLYSIADSTETRYETSPVPAEAFARYRAAWNHWVAERYRNWRSGRGRA